MYNASMDAGELREALEAAKDARRHLEYAIDYLADIGAVSARDSAEDALKELDFELEELDRLVGEANRREADEEMREYFRAVV